MDKLCAKYRRIAIIAPKPLFYMDFEGDIEDELEFASEGYSSMGATYGADPFSIDEIERGVAAMKDRLMAAETQ